MSHDKQLWTLGAIFGLLLILFVGITNAANWTMSQDGKYVSWSNANAIINCTAVSNELINQQQICDFTWLGASSHTLNASFVFNVNEATPKKAYIWQNSAHTLYHDVSTPVNHSITLTPSGIYTTNASCYWGAGAIKRNLTFVNGSNTTSQVYCFDSFQNLSNGSYVLWSVWNDMVSTPYTSWYNDWVDISSAFSLSQFGSYKVATAQGTWTSGETKRLKILYDTPVKSSGKFDIYFHTGSAAQAVADPSRIKLKLDPWWNTTFMYRQPISILTNVSVPNGYPYRISVNTSALISAGKLSSDCLGIGFTLNGTTETPLNFTYEKNCSTNNTIFLIQLPNFTSATNLTIYMYYGNNTFNGSNISNVFPTGLRRYYPLDGDVNEYWGNYNLSVLSGPTVSTGRRNLANEAYAFNNDGRLQGTGSDVGLPNGTQSSTICAWFLLNTSGTFRKIVYYGTRGTIGQYRDMFSRDALPTNGLGAETWGSQVMGTSNSLNTWTLGCISYDGTQWRVWKNGSFENSGTQTTNTVLSTLVIGGDQTGVNLWTGKIQEVSIYSSNFSTTDAAALYVSSEPLSAFGAEESSVSLTFVSQSPANGSIFNYSLVNYSWVLNMSGVNLTLCNLSVNGSVTANIVCTNSTANCSQTATTNEGISSWNITCWNGTTSTTSNTSIITIDLTAPNISIQQPTGFKNSTNVSFNYTASDVNAITCAYSLNGAAYSTLASCANTTLLGVEGANNLTLRVNDSAGNFNSATTTFTVDTIAPAITINAPQNTTYNTTFIAMNVTTSDANLDTCEYSFNDPYQVYTCNTTVSLLAMEGTQVLLLYANDTAGNVNRTNVTFFVDSIAPVVSIGSPANGSIQTDVNISLNFTVDATAVSCWFTLSDVPGTNYSLPGCSNSTFLGLVSGSHTLTVYANDSVGNIGSYAVVFATSYVYGVNASVPVNGSVYSGGEVEFWFTPWGFAGTDTNCTLYIDGVAGANGSCITNDVCVVHANVSYTNGSYEEHNWSVTCVYSTQSASAGNYTLVSVPSSFGATMQSAKYYIKANFNSFFSYIPIFVALAIGITLMSLGISMGLFIGGFMGVLVAYALEALSWNVTFALGFFILVGLIIGVWGVVKTK